ncbi:hypothetical protein mvi_43170 [Methylobacterium indicum]|uniref:Uncharacterized protein n=1 Tax=Methylobacterium indicum TaxID=1775910 RepID=A0A8H8WWM3_9HYPH|nr:hypothetical protein mvi_43170 [Methylobacterium indicum]
MPSGPAWPLTGGLAPKKKGHTEVWPKSREETPKEGSNAATPSPRCPTKLGPAGIAGKGPLGVSWH